MKQTLSETQKEKEAPCQRDHSSYSEAIKTISLSDLFIYSDSSHRWCHKIKCFPVLHLQDQQSRQVWVSPCSAGTWAPRDHTDLGAVSSCRSPEFLACGWCLVVVNNALCLARVLVAPSCLGLHSSGASLGSSTSPNG